MGSVVPDQTVDVVVDTPALAVVDGKYGFGQTVTPQAVQIGIDKCRRRRASRRWPCATQATSAGSATGPRWRPRRGWSRSISSTPRAACWWRPMAACSGASRPRPIASAFRAGPGPARARLRHLGRGRGQGAGGEPGRQENARRRADRCPTASRAAIRTCSMATTRRPARATTARAPAPSAPSATTRARASPSCASCWAARCRAPAPPIPSAALRQRHAVVLRRSQGARPSGLLPRRNRHVRRLRERPSRRRGARGADPRRARARMRAKRRPRACRCPTTPGPPS